MVLSPIDEPAVPSRPGYFVDDPSGLMPGRWWRSAPGPRASLAARGLLPTRVVAARLRAVAADGHVAPAARAVLALVEKEPRAGDPSALADARDVVRGQ